MEAEAASWLLWLEDSALAEAVRGSTWGYPIIEAVHILGFVVVVGAAFMFDLRLLGMSRSLPVSALARHLLRWSRGGAVVVVPSGLLLFIASATELASSPVFRLKLVLIAAAATNAAVFHLATFGSVGRWEREVPAPAAARLAAVLSLVLWTGVITCGRLIAYF
ncbi:MAG TPA: hypothetical protein VGR19_06065 [Allosphingosinicella sp.]|nr:hypothetical protein [Allosphingosinicella sp.]